MMNGFGKSWRVAVTIAVIALLTASFTVAEVYRVVDEQGRVTFTDSPPPGSKAEPLNLQESNRLPPPSALPPRPEPKQQAEIPDYQVVITSPPPNFHVTPGIRDVDVEISVTPGLRAGHRIELTDNGEVVAGRTLQNIVVRGTHVLLARVVDREGKVLSESEPVQIHVHRPSVGGRRP